jgi:hypothetical protein
VREPCLRQLSPPLDPLALGSKFQHLAPTVRATKKPPAMAPKKANSKATRLRRQHCLPQKRARPSPSPTPPTKRLLKTTFSAPAKTTLSAPAAPKDNRNLPQASPHRRARTSPRTARSSASQRKNSYSCVLCASRTAISRGKRRYWRPSASVCPH